ncbi:hypothetical protein [Nonomuraea sp. KM90]|uniref:hypothetical protein n=1 Tax=Nonomuraea sp. KM90 TaxID=3457428 RepID=UPI003FCEAD5A
MLVTGESSVGKTRLAHWALMTVLPRWRLISPRDGTVVNDLADSPNPPGRLVVWLDELQDYLQGPWQRQEGSELSPDALKRLLLSGTRVVVVGTMWSDRYRELLRLDRRGAPVYPRAYRALKLAGHHVALAASLSGEEQARAKAVATRDGRIARALSSASAGFGVTQALAGGQFLIKRWENASEPERSLITGAIDARRLGVQSRLSPELLRALARAYLHQPAHDDAWFETALAYATEVRHDEAATALLLAVPDSANLDRVGYALAEYLLQEGLKRRAGHSVPELAWQAFTEHVTAPADLLSLGANAERRGMLRHAEDLFRRAGRRPAPTPATTGEAEEKLRQDLAAGDTECWAELVRILQEQGRWEDTEEVLRGAVADGEAQARTELAWLLASLGRTAEAQKVWQDCPDAPEARLQEAALRDFLSQLTSGNQLMRMTTMGPSAWNYSSAFEAGDKRRAARHLARQVALSGVASAWLSIRVGEDSLTGKALIKHWHDAVAHDAPGARHELAAAQARGGDKAEQRWRDAVVSQVPGAWRELAGVLENRHGAGHAERELRQAVAAGDPEALWELQRFLRRRERDSEVEGVWLEAIVAGVPGAFRGLLGLLRRQGRTTEADRLCTYGLNADGTAASPPPESSSHPVPGKEVMDSTNE